MFFCCCVYVVVREKAYSASLFVPTKVPCSRVLFYFIIIFFFCDFCFSGAVGVGDTAPVACRPRPDVLLRAASRCRYSLQQNPGHPRHAPADGTGKPGGQKRTDRTINMHILVHPRFRSKFRDNLQLCCF